MVWWHCTVIHNELAKRKMTNNPEEWREFWILFCWIWWFWSISVTWMIYFYYYIIILRNNNVVIGSHLPSVLLAGVENVSVSIFSEFFPLSGEEDRSGCPKSASSKFAHPSPLVWLSVFAFEDEVEELLQATNRNLNFQIDTKIILPKTGSPAGSPHGDCGDPDVSIFSSFLSSLFSLVASTAVGCSDVGSSDVLVPWTIILNLKAHPTLLTSSSISVIQSFSCSAQSSLNKSSFDFRPILSSASSLSNISSFWSEGKSPSVSSSTPPKSHWKSGEIFCFYKMAKVILKSKKVGSISMVISPEFRMWQYRDDE